ncbi:MAG: type III secretion inner membrane ring lipoprotein SctJ [Waddliaceae bacterium]|jgi:type III secretion protein J|nr:type III secretion inner membrane ring lipoprotein SctJ [Waddliaceae bacterium]MBT3579352.1 type III secretion inner membrane ring lipoprotein SctJ [Waddliaceae bacterium]MBT4444842.1 type III secretion inner membrane ring lipoprotein SctJ [Waddliaceae bacterium]MBT6928022.1 type III secretion inner membrane ring lipoprotein SctJ [Waddliaceae bacterium]MBT7264302.1 type III secretion inner membrane ring lipoprotein SctJ [Waddliaceae bacterium]
MKNKKTFFNTVCCGVNLFVVCALFVGILTSCNRQVSIVNSVSEREANEVIVFLASKDIRAIKIKNADSGGAGKELLWDVSVSSRRATDAMAMLNVAGLPRKKGQTLLELFAKSGLVSSESDAKIRYQAGLAEQLANTIRKIDGVIDADIQLSFPEVSEFGQEDDGIVTASVYVKHQGILDDPNAHLIPKIKRLVASSINGLSFENVTVISDKSRFLSAIDIVSGEDSIGGDRDYAKIWSVIVDKDSVGRFRTIFFTFSIIVILVLFILIWIVWKIFPLLHQVGGFHTLFSLKAFEEGSVDKTEEEAEEVEEKNAEEVPEETVVEEEPVEEVAIEKKPVEEGVVEEPTIAEEPEEKEEPEEEE